MKEMIYTENRHTPEILDKGEYRGVEYVVISLGTHPTAYVKNIIKVSDYTDERFCGIYVHGGVTYLGDAYWTDLECKIPDTKYLGWDYAHAGDYVGWHDHCTGEDIKWTTEEIVVECKRVIDQLLNLVEFENNQINIKKNKKFL